MVGPDAGDPYSDIDSAVAAAALASENVVYIKAKATPYAAPSNPIPDGFVFVGIGATPTWNADALIRRDPFTSPSVFVDPTNVRIQGTVNIAAGTRVTFKNLTLTQNAANSAPAIAFPVGGIVVLSDCLVRPSNMDAGMTAPLVAAAGAGKGSPAIIVADYTTFASETAVISGTNDLFDATGMLLLFSNCGFEIGDRFFVSGTTSSFGQMEASNCRFESGIFNYPGTGSISKSLISSFIEFVGDVGFGRFDQCQISSDINHLPTAPEALGLYQCGFSGTFSAECDQGVSIIECNLANSTFSISAASGTFLFVGSSIGVVSATSTATGISLQMNGCTGNTPVVSFEEGGSSLDLVDTSLQTLTLNGNAGSPHTVEALTSSISNVNVTYDSDLTFRSCHIRNLGLNNGSTDCSLYSTHVQTLSSSVYNSLYTDNPWDGGTWETLPSPANFTPPQFEIFGAGAATPTETVVKYAFSFAPASGGASIDFTGITWVPGQEVVVYDAGGNASVGDPITITGYAGPLGAIDSSYGAVKFTYDGTNLVRHAFV